MSRPYGWLIFEALTGSKISNSNFDTSLFYHYVGYPCKRDKIMVNRIKYGLAIDWKSEKPFFQAYLLKLEKGVLFWTRFISLKKSPQNKSIYWGGGLAFLTIATALAVSEPKKIQAISVGLVLALILSNRYWFFLFPKLPSSWVALCLAICFRKMARCFSSLALRPLGAKQV